MTAQGTWNLDVRIRDNIGRQIKMELNENNEAMYYSIPGNWHSYDETGMVAVIIHADPNFTALAWSSVLGPHTGIYGAYDRNLKYGEQYQIDKVNQAEPIDQSGKPTETMGTATAEESKTPAPSTRVPGKKVIDEDQNWEFTLRERDGTEYKESITLFVDRTINWSGTWFTDEETMIGAIRELSDGAEAKVEEYTLWASLPDRFEPLNREMELNWNRQRFVYKIIQEPQPELE